MAESIAIHFFEATPPQIEAAFPSLGLFRIPDSASWRAPAVEDYAVTLYFDTFLINEYDDQLDEMLRLFNGALPSCSLQIELRRSRTELACEICEALTVGILQRFSGIAHDLHSAFWSIEEIIDRKPKSEGRFLEWYKPRRA